MKKAPIPENEVERLSVVNKYATEQHNQRLDALVKEAASALSAPMASINILDEADEVCMACIGELPERAPRDISFCGHALVAEDAIICCDTLKDERFADNPYVVGEPYIRFYAGMRLLDRESRLPIGVFCVKDIEPREFSIKELGEFFELAERAESAVQR